MISLVHDFGPFYSLNMHDFWCRSTDYYLPVCELKCYQSQAAVKTKDWPSLVSLIVCFRQQQHVSKEEKSILSTNMSDTNNAGVELVHVLLMFFCEARNCSYNFS